MNGDIAYRRIVGLVLGASLGLIYGLVSQYINRIALPDIPFYQPPLGPIGNVLIWLLIGALLGLLSAWPCESIQGALLGGITGAIMLMMLTLLTGRMDSEVLTGKIAGVFLLFLPFVGALTPLVGIHRLAVNKIVEAHIESSPWWIAARWPLLLIIILAVIGTTVLLRDYARIMLARTNSLIVAGLKASDAAALPPLLQGERIGSFLSNAQLSYTLQWENKQINRFAIPRPMTDRPNEESAVIARFKNGWTLVCLYGNSDVEPVCKGFEQVE